MIICFSQLLIAPLHNSLHWGYFVRSPQVLAWITQQKEKGSVDEIEDVDRPMLEMLLDQMEAVTVVFCECDPL